MRFVSLIIVLSLLALGTLAYAKDKEKNEAVRSEPPRAEIVADDERGAIRFVIDGKTVALIDATGLHVREHISYGRNLTDYGPQGFDAHVSEAAHAQ
jgi:hypothetical protein